MGKWKRARSLPRRWQRNHLINKYGAECYICKEPFATLSEVTIDHWVPLSKGGADAMENYRLAHFDCNQLKADLMPEEFRLFQVGSIQYAV